MGFLKSATSDQVTIFKAVGTSVVSIVVGTFLAHEWLFGTFMTRASADDNLATKQDIVKIETTLKSINRSIQYQRLGIISNNIQNSKSKLSETKNKDEKVFIKENISRLHQEKAELETSLGLPH